MNFHEVQVARTLRQAAKVRFVKSKTREPVNTCQVLVARTNARPGEGGGGQEDLHERVAIRENGTVSRPHALMYRTALAISLLAGLTSCTPSAPPALTPSKFLGVHPSDPTVRDRATCGVLYALSGKMLGKDPSTTNRRAIETILYDYLTYKIDDSFKREELIQRAIPMLEEHIDGLPKNEFSVALRHFNSNWYKKQIGDYDFERKGFKPVASFILDGHELEFSEVGSTRTCDIKLKYEKPLPMGSFDYRFEVPDEMTAREIEAHRVNDQLVVRLIVEPIDIRDDHTTISVLVKEIRFETNKGKYLGRAERLPGE